MKNHLIVIFMWFWIIFTILILNFLEIPIIDNTIVSEFSNENIEANLLFSVKKSKFKPLFFYFFNEKKQKIVFKKFNQFSENSYLVENFEFIQIPKNFQGFVNYGTETILNYFLNSIF
ncbi:hypothetical protein SSABA_v1c03130 [Spiroplasma sabaudiense Ar-1343]|uniref:Uncharacterized protein n=1 Tax=Spiroplasma sabaudiense Ar-1343 TaxID=1276257 RepID=W6AA66_9MOLU|nr:hypothetical protein [Spiroplasma sabaudiense]AHI53725.1 hypothetical protein SSABA_v1c03130 [Spiroplasma sabaudiense Ar-1343]